jgi:hypothetical protein
VRPQVLGAGWFGGEQEAPGERPGVVAAVMTCHNGWIMQTGRDDRTQILVLVT